MYVEAYELIREVLEDEELQACVKELTGKRLAVIDSGPLVTSPAAGIIFEGGEITRAENTIQSVDYTVTFTMPHWGRDGMMKCHRLLDEAVEAFFAHEIRAPSGRSQERNFVMTANPTLMEEDPEDKWWAVALRVTVSIFRG